MRSIVLTSTSLPALPVEILVPTIHTGPTIPAVLVAQCFERTQLGLTLKSGSQAPFEYHSSRPE